MKKNQDIPAHSYNEFVENVQHTDGEFPLSIDPKLPLVLTRFEFMNEIAQADYPHSHDCYEILYISEGEGTHVIDFEPYPIQAPVFFFLSKDQVHFWQLTRPLKGFALLLSEEFLGFPSSNIVRAHDLSFFHHVGQDPHLSIDENQFAVTRSLLEGIEQEFHNDNARSLSVLRAYLHILLTQLNRSYIVDLPGEQSQATSSMVRQFKQLVSEHFLSEQSVQDYAGRMGISASHLRDTVKAVTGHAPGHIIRGKVILEAKRLLAHTNLTVAEIGYDLNFEDSSYFGRFFKRETGISPVAFRKQIREQYRISPE